jgi:poly(3-hydroxybutyrate) depolymerase
MLYQLFQAQADMAAPVRVAAGFWSEWLKQSQSMFADPDGWRRRLAATCAVMARTGVTHARLPFGIDEVQIGNRRIAVTEEVVDSTPFATLLHFAKDTGAAQPKLLVVAPMSGHFATLLRGTVRTLLADNDVYLTDWRNARDVKLSDGSFDFDDFTDHITRFLERLGPDSHVLAVCQPTVAVLSAVALMAQAGNPAQPRSMTLMAGPIDTRISPTAVNDLANKHSFEWFERNLICKVPGRYAGAGRRVYPGFLQLTAFMAMNQARHEQAFRDYHSNLVDGETSKAETHEAFYDEYFAVMDLTAEFYLDTIAKVFQQHELPRGVMKFRDQLIEPAAIRRTALLTVEGELDDICAIGQTMAAHDLCSGLRPGMKRHHLQSGVGHYGVFNGRRWTNSIYPQVRDIIQAHAA